MTQKGKIIGCISYFSTVKEIDLQHLNVCAIKIFSCHARAQKLGTQ